MSFIPIIENQLIEDDFQSIDLSAETLDNHQVNASSQEELSNYLLQQARLYPNKLFYGGYLEKRNLYQGKELFEENEVRDIHLGIDFWANAGTGILCPFDAQVVVARYNKGKGNYGGTIILKHQQGQEFFYTLYGHLSKASVQQYQVNALIQKGSLFCRLGEPSENGGYIPHLHFQVMLEIDENELDYPGVCSQNKLSFYKNNCPNPLTYLGFKN